MPSPNFQMPEKFTVLERSITVAKISKLARAGRCDEIRNDLAFELAWGRT
jgi:hypothetical protein